MIAQKKFRFLAPAAAKSDADGGGTGGDDKALLDDKGTFSGGGDGGGDGKKADPTPKTEAKVKVRVGNDEIETDAASAAAINALLQNNSQLYDYIKQAGIGKAPADDGKKKAGYDYATGLFTEPEVALQKLREEIKAEVKGEITTAYNAAESQKDFWNSFYSENADLKDEKMIVNAVMARDWATLKDLDPKAAAKKLVEATKKELMRLKGGKSDSDPDARQIEGGSNKNSAPSGKKEDDSKVLSLSDIIKKRQEARRKAQFSKE